MMPEVLGNPPSPRTALFWNGTAWQWALVDAAGHLQIDALSTAMDPLAATAAAQALALAQLQLIEDMRDALQSVATDRLIVRGEDQLFSFKGVLAKSKTVVISGVDGHGDSDAVPAGEIWIVRHAYAVDVTSPTTRHIYRLEHDAVAAHFYYEEVAFAAQQASHYACFVPMDESDVIRVEFRGGLAGDSLLIRLVGYRMTLET